jgi:hypothetical protein
MKSITAALTAIFATVLLAANAEAAVRQINFSADPLNLGADEPFGVGVGEGISGSFTFDDAGVGADSENLLTDLILSLNFQTGVKVWELGDLDAASPFNSLNFSGGAVSLFRLDAVDADGRVIVSSVNTANLIEEGVASIACNSCVSFEEVDVAAIPLPAALPLMAAGLGMLGLMGYRRRTSA